MTSTITTAEAATQAHVTINTVRAWARRGIIAATKQAGRWIIDSASLAHRITIGKMKRRTRKPAPAWTTETMVAIGGNRWQRAGHDRVYFNNWAELAGIEVSRYNTGNISSAAYQDEGISNSQAYKLLECIDKVWFDAEDGKLHCRYGYGESRVASPKELWAAVVAGIRTALAAL
ncbi:helix-turn-helix domain-containing protein [Streptomyces sp. NPDC060243]|uniref:helix-turn-helix domain-containing protein n=1 Tax=Streptomyces sp. NPDC060243 TaxID=3347081 RepID=UPI003666570D